MHLIKVVHATEISKTQKAIYILVGFKIVSEYWKCRGHVAATVFLV